MIGTLQQESITAAARLLAASMRDNPLHQRVFASDDAQLEPLLADAFARLLHRQMRTGCVLGAYEGDVLTGVAAMVPPGHCQPGLQEKLAMLSILARGRALRRLPRIRRWLQTWARHDPGFDHWHLGPAAVDRTRQGQGIGSQLMEVICDRLDRHQGIGYLETDKPENVRLYRRGGFEVCRAAGTRGEQLVHAAAAAEPGLRFRLIADVRSAAQARAAVVGEISTRAVSRSGCRAGS